MENIAPGSIIHSDDWGAYKSIPKLREVVDGHYVHKTVNHSEEFKAKDGTHTNTIEGTWNTYLKSKISPQHYNDRFVGGCIYKQQFINDCLKKDACPWEAMWELIRASSFGDDGLEVDEDLSPLKRLREKPYKAGHLQDLVASNARFTS